MKPLVFVTGMFRSGTTLMARMMNAHKNIAFASDPYQPTLKAFRNAVWANLEGADKIDPVSPFDDYYFYDDKQRLMEAVNQADFDLSLGDLDLVRHREQTARYAHDFSAKIEPYLDKFKGETFGELLEAGCDILDLAYGDENTRMVGFKITWAGEFAPHILKKWPQAKVIHIVRDPRGVCSSKNALGDRKNPFLFLVRQWRKLVTLPWMQTRDNFPYSDRVHVLRYEDLVSNPEHEIARICSFLDLPLSEEMLDPACYKDGNDDPWKPNTSYTEKSQRFNTSSIDNWRTFLSPEQLDFIERLSFAEMDVWGYKPEYADSPLIPASMIFDPPEVPKEEMVEWIIPYTHLEPDTLLHDMTLESARASALMSSKDVDDRLKRALALDSCFFDELRTRVKQLCSNGVGVMEEE